MKKKLSIGLVFAIVLMLITVSVLAAVLLSGKDFVQEVMRPKAQESQSQSWTEEEVAEILRIAEENGLSLPEEQQAQLLAGGGYYKEELMRLFAKLALGAQPSTWSIEDQAWYSQMMVDIGFIKESYSALPDEGEAAESEVLAKVQAYIHQQYDPAVPLTDEAIYRRHTTYQWMDEGRQEKQWHVQYEPLDLVHSAFYFRLDTEANILGESMIPGIAGSGESPTPDAVLFRYEELFGKFHEWEMETWVGFQQLLREVAGVHGFGNNEILALLSLSEFTLPQEGMQSKDAAIDAAMMAVMARENIQESDLQRDKAYGVYLLGDDAPVWKVTIPAAKDGSYIAEVNAQTGEARNIHLIPLHGIGSMARRFMLESVYQAHHKEAELREGVLCFDGKLVGCKPLKNGDFLLTGFIWVDTDTTDAWAARVSPNGVTLWEVRNADGMRFEEAVALSDGGFLLAMIPKKSNDPFTLAVVSLDANGQLLGGPVTLEAQGWAFEGKDCLLVNRNYDIDSRPLPITYLAVNGKGETLWEHTYEEMKGTGGHPHPAADGYIWSGMAQEAPFNQTNSKGMMTRLDDQGNLLWKRLMEQYPYTGISRHLEANDGGMFGTGMNFRIYQDDAELYQMSPFVVRFDADGNVLWCHYYPQLEQTAEDLQCLDFVELLPAPNDGVLVIAIKRGMTDDLRFIHLDRNGAVLADWWEKVADFPIDFAEAFIAGEQSYLVYHDKSEYGPSNNTYITPFTWPEN